MYYGRKKAIIIAIVSSILVIAMLFGGIFVYITTDLFKSNQMLFFKYMGESLKNIAYVENTQISEINALAEEMPYTMQGTVHYANEEESTNQFQNLTIGVEAKVNKPEERNYAKVQLTNQNEELFSIEYANSNNIYALKSDEIVTAFLGIENENLKVLAQKLGVLDTSMIPDKIEKINWKDFLTITEEEKEHIKETYSTVLMQHISKENFSKETNLAVSKEEVMYNTTAYRLSLNAEELKQLQIACLQTLKEDSITLNFMATKAKMLGLDESYTQINNLTNEIQKQISTINNRQTSVGEGISIILYVDKGQVITTEIIVKNETKYTIYGESKPESSKRYLLIESLSAETDYNRIEISEQETRGSLESTYNMLIDIDHEIGIDISLTNTGAASENSFNTTCEVSVNQEERNDIIRYEQEITFVDEIENEIELNRNNCGILNDYTTDQLKGLMQAIGERAMQVLTEKLLLVIGQQNAM